jgi:DNA repair protein RadC
MRIYEAKLVFHLVKDGPAEPVNTAPKVVAYLQYAFDENPTVEHFIVIFLNRKNVPTGYIRISSGTLSNTLVHPREVFRAAILAHAAGIIVAHNHPSGDPSPSAADIAVTRQLRDAAKLLDIILIDHVVVGEVDCDPTGLGHYSFRNSGLI